MTNVFKTMTAKERRAAMKYINQENAKYSDTFVEIPPDKWNTEIIDEKRIAVFRNRRFIVQIFQEKETVRLSINKTMIDAKGHFLADISWEELQAIKNAVGYSDADAVEIFPRDIDTVNVANMRHLWILTKDLPFIWRSKRSEV